ncbi:MAG: Nramp family divalent metal transporter [Gammaproteobacteria bacterium]|nr:Nramp family divalent metal transporter [Gammaproteobacteria bacterium]
MIRLRELGPGIVIAATGLGAGDLIAASVAGAKYGVAILWAAVMGAILKFTLNEGLARWQLATGTTLLEGWVRRLPRFWSVYFFVYLLLWSFIVAGALMAATGLAIHALVPAISVEAGGAVQSLIAAALVLLGRYRLLEVMMKFFIALMFAVVMYCAVALQPDWGAVVAGIFVPRLPEGSVFFLLGVMGGVGGSVTLLSYGYWIRERGWSGPERLRQVRTDLLVAYVLTGLFGIAIMIISAGVSPEVLSGSKMVLAVADEMGATVGDIGKWAFLIGFWGAVFSSMLGVWQGVPYLFADFVHEWRRSPDEKVIDTRAKPYRVYLAFLAIPPMILLWAGKPVWVVLVYAVAGAAFMPLLAGLLLYMNGLRDWLGPLRNRVPGNLALAATLILFTVLLVNKLLSM